MNEDDDPLSDANVAWELRSLEMLFPPDFRPRAVARITHGNGTVMVSMTAKQLREVAAILNSAATRLETLQ